MSVPAARAPVLAVCVAVWVMVTVVQEVCVTKAEANLHGADLTNGSCVCSVWDTQLSRQPGYRHPAIMYLLHNHCVLTNGDVRDIELGERWYTVVVEGEVLWGDGATLANGKIRRGVCGLP